MCEIGLTDGNFSRIFFADGNDGGCDIPVAPIWSKEIDVNDGVQRVAQNIRSGEYVSFIISF